MIQQNIVHFSSIFKTNILRGRIEYELTYSLRGVIAWFKKDTILGMGLSSLLAPYNISIQISYLVYKIFESQVKYQHIHQL